MSGYTGRVGPGGPAQTRELAHLIITKVSVGTLDNNCYLLRCRRSGRQLLIDAATDAARLLRVIGPDGLEAIVTTHRHADHVGALDEVARRTGARTYAHAADADALPLTPDERLVDGALLELGEIRLECLHLAGHTPGGVALLYDDPEGPPHLFTGDSLFPGGVGNTWGDPAAFQQLFDDVRRKVFDRLPDETWIYPGHGDDTTVGAQRPHLSEWRARGY